MFKVSGLSEIGQSHIGKGVCQDSCFYRDCGRFVVAAVADGLGSSKHSDIASKMAAERSVDYCIKKIQREASRLTSSGGIKSLIREVFDQVNFEIKQTAGDDLDDYDTTLTLAIYFQGRVFYGHAGDSGIIALRADGKFACVTEQQNGAGVGKERPVFPLSAESYWVFGDYPDKVKALFMMTDGVWNKCVPPLLEGQEYELDHTYLYYLYGNFNKQTGSGSLDRWIRDEVANISPNEINYDDKTLVMIIDEDIPLKPQKTAYYSFPDSKLWDALLKKHEQELYSYRFAPESGQGQKTAVTDYMQSPTRRPSAQPGGGDRSAQATRVAAAYQKNSRSNITRHFRKALPAFAFLALGVIVFAAGWNLTKSSFDVGEIEPITAEYTGKKQNFADAFNEGIEGKIRKKTKKGDVLTGVTIKYSLDGEKYDAEFPSLTDAGEYTVLFSVSKPHFETTGGKCIVDIKRKNLKDSVEVTIPEREQYYANGKEVRPKFDVKPFDSSIKIDPEHDYKFSYADNTEITSEAKVIVTFEGNYDGVAVGTFRIVEKPVVVVGLEGINSINVSWDSEVSTTAYIGISGFDDITISIIEGEGDPFEEISREIVRKLPDGQKGTLNWSDPKYGEANKGMLPTEDAPSHRLQWSFVPDNAALYQKCQGSISFEWVEDTTNENKGHDQTDTDNNSDGNIQQPDSPAPTITPTPAPTSPPNVSDTASPSTSSATLAATPSGGVTTGQDPILITIESGVRGNASVVAAELKAQGILEDDADFVKYLTDNGYDLHINPGKYSFEPGENYDDICKKIVLPAYYPGE